MYAKNIRPSAKREVYAERSADTTLELCALCALESATNENVSAKEADFL